MKTDNKNAAQIHTKKTETKLHSMMFRKRKKTFKKRVNTPNPNILIENSKIMIKVPLYFNFPLKNIYFKVYMINWRN